MAAGQPEVEVEMTQTQKQVYSLEGVVTKIDHGENRVSYLITQSGRQYPESPPVSFFGDAIDDLPEITEGQAVLARFTLSERKTSPQDGREGKPYKDGVSIAAKSGGGPYRTDATYNAPAPRMVVANEDELRAKHGLDEPQWPTSHQRAPAAPQPASMPALPDLSRQPSAQPLNGMAWGACQNNATTIVTSEGYPKPVFADSPDEEVRAWYAGEVLALATMLYEQRPQ
jgi:hypothetical protein